jgi:hypothetical protein
VSLYLCIFAEGVEVAGVEVGGYSDFAAFRQHIAEHQEAGRPGERFPLLLLHSDCAGQWPAADCGRLRLELARLRAEMGADPVLAAFCDVDGENLVEQLAALAEIALASGQPILFQ